jgi:hypothetical protein
MNTEGCQYIITKGINKGSNCKTKKCIDGFCKKHSTTNESILQKQNYYEENKESILQKRKDYYDENKESILQKQRDYYKENRESIIEIQKKHYKENKESILEKHKIYRDSNKEKIKEYYEEHKEEKILYDKNRYESMKEKLNEKCICKCGKKYTLQNKTRHEKTKKHQQYLQQQ